MRRLCQIDFGNDFKNKKIIQKKYFSNMIYKKGIIFGIIWLLLVVAVFFTGCDIHTDQSKNLVITELFGMKLSEPYGGEIKMREYPKNDFGIDYVSEWQTLADNLNMKWRGFYYYGDVMGVSKGAWSVVEGVEKDTGTVIELLGTLDFDPNRHKKKSENNRIESSKRKLVELISDKFNVSYEHRYLDVQGDGIGSRKKTTVGGLCEEFEWNDGLLIVKLKLRYDNPIDKDEGKGSISLSVARKDYKTILNAGRD